MTNRKHHLPLVQQCKALKGHRTTVYREPKPVNQAELVLMREIDTIHMDSPKWGCRKVREYLIEMGYPSGPPNCTTLFRNLGIHCSARKPRTTIRNMGHKVYPHFLRHLEIVKPNQVWAMDITYTPGGQGPCMPGMRDGHLQQKESVQRHFKHTGCEFLR